MTNQEDVIIQPELQLVEVTTEKTNEDKLKEIIDKVEIIKELLKKKKTG